MSVTENARTGMVLQSLKRHDYFLNDITVKLKQMLVVEHPLCGISPEHVSSLKTIFIENVYDLSHGTISVPPPTVFENRPHLQSSVLEED